MSDGFSLRSWLGGLAQLALFPIVLFLFAGTLLWPAAWLFLLLFYCFAALVVLWLKGRDPELLGERMSIQGPQEGRDWMFALVLVVSVLWLVAIPLDAMRFHVSHLSLLLQIVGALLLVAAYVMMFLAFLANAYVTPTARIQKERGQSVVRDGAYRYVRHPMYTGFVLFYVGTPLLLGSVIGLALAPLLVYLVGWRAVLEERLLHDGLPGYAEYQREVHFRFVPHVW